MSRWSAERLHVALAPERVELTRPGLWPGRPAAHAAGATCSPRAGEPAWQAALDALDGLLGAFNARGEAVTVVLSNHWVRYLVLPWHAELTGADELAQLARVRFEQTYGAAAADWTIRIDGGWGAPHVACAIDSALFTELQRRLAAHGLRLRSLQPLLMSACNGQRHALAGERSAFAVIEPGRICLSLLGRGRWLEVSNRRAGDDVPEAVERELATLDADAVPPQLDVLLVGEGARWPDAPTARPARLLDTASRPRQAITRALRGARLRRLDLDLVRPGPAWPAWLLLIAGLALAAHTGLGYLALHEQQAQLQQRSARPHQAIAAPTAAVSDETRRELAAARQVLQELALPWEPLFRLIEGALMADAALLAIEPDAGKGALRIRGEARDYPAILAFMRRLEASPGDGAGTTPARDPEGAPLLAGVHLLNHEIREDVAERPYLFTLVASWRTAP
ncbi:hypothetical protein Lcho_3881 [Leptothrix cholodnii SP-6]|uniref:Fimbrial assembly family protein n=1 Tax=Leptothrix cholodnii (strain ATCC 51168 / LMG 8142 / SP-6) TaxID=395495 RepID=B1Y7I7_LEPCP|nr:PilN domain-containing protein [Leptothrix cholodnii]ACB36135.1 hypothetical protein Lcho_3881 [Leptothrix cholodnii SP-6]